MEMDGVEERENEMHYEILNVPSTLLDVILFGPFCVSDEVGGEAC